MFIYFFARWDHIALHTQQQHHTMLYFLPTGVREILFSILINGIYVNKFYMPFRAEVK